MSYKLNKPYTDEEYAKFIVEHNHCKGMLIKETENAIFALEENEIMGGNNEPIINPDYEEQKALMERERLNNLNLTAADVERAIYKVKGIDFDDLIALVEQTAQLSQDETIKSIDIKALKIELRANNFYRGNPYIEQIGTMLGFSSEQLDRFFETKDYLELTK